MSRTIVDPERFHDTRPTDLRRARPWHRLGYIIWLLPRRISALVEMLGVPPRARVLDFGCAEQPYRTLFDPQAEFIGADLPGNPHAEMIISADGTLPAPDASFDAILSTQVLEHVADPATYLGECQRLLKPGGRLLLTTHGLMVYHPDPVDYWRWTRAGLCKAAGDAGLRVLHSEGIMGVTAAGLQFVQDGLYWRAPRRFQPLLATIFQSLIALADRLEPPEARDGNALVFAIIAERPPYQEIA